MMLKWKEWDRDHRWKDRTCRALCTEIIKRCIARLNGKRERMVEKMFSEWKKLDLFFTKHAFPVDDSNHVLLFLASLGGEESEDNSTSMEKTNTVMEENKSSMGEKKKLKTERGFCANPGQHDVGQHSVCLDAHALENPFVEETVVEETAPDNAVVEETIENAAVEETLPEDVVVEETVQEEAMDLDAAERALTDLLEDHPNGEEAVREHNVVEDVHVVDEW